MTDYPANATKLSPDEDLWFGILRDLVERTRALHGGMPEFSNRELAELVVTDILKSDVIGMLDGTSTPLACEFEPTN